MGAKTIGPLLTLWASAYLGCVFLLLLGLLPHGWLSIELLAQLCWLGLIGSVPTMLVLGAASRAAGASPAAILASTLAVLVFTLAIGWPHTDFILSGAQWLEHPQRGLVRLGMVAAFGLFGAAGWLWLLLGERLGARLQRLAWALLTGVPVALMLSAISRYRAYDYSIAQLVLPAGLLCAGMFHNLVRGSRHWPVLLGAAFACVLYGLGSRVDTSLAATGERELVAHSRVGALVSLYILPRLGSQESGPLGEHACAPPRPRVDETPIGIEASARRNVILISVDALRADVLGLEVDGRPVTPELSRLGKSAVSFENATSTYPATLFAVGSAFSGLSPAELYLAPALPETIFTRSRTQVDRQLAVLPDVSWFRLPIVERFLAPGVPIDFAPSDTSATDALIAQLRQARAEGASVMAWVHYYSPHDPYIRHAQFPFGAGKKNAYLSEVAYFDQELGRLFRYLEEDAWLRDSLVLFFSDHGEALGEKSYFGHHVYLDGWMIDVPLMIWHEGLSPEKRQLGASVADIAPTVLQFLGLPAPSDSPAQSLLTADHERLERPTFSEAFPVRGRELFDSFSLPSLDEATIRARMRSIRVASKGYEPKGAITVGSHRLIHHRGADATLLYRRQADGTETPVRGAEGAETSKRLRSELERWEREQTQRIRCRLRLSE